MKGEYNIFPFMPVRSCRVTIQDMGGVSQPLKSRQQRSTKPLPKGSTSPNECNGDTAFINATVIFFQ